MSDEVSDFLRSVEALKGRREEEDEARSRELEEKILQEKRERQARRERARSISPQKSSPANTPPPSSQVQQRSSIVQPLEESNAAASSPALESSGSPQPRAAIRSPKAMEHTTDFLASTSPTKENESPFFESESKRGSTTSLNSPSSAIAPSRTPLSWQRRPASQASERSKPRTLSMVAAENAAAKSSPNLTDSAASPTEQPALSREQIAQSLSGKDPAWFRQTADRGQNSAAYRRDQSEDQDTTDMSALRTQLPGMVRDSVGTPTESSMMTSDPRSSSPALLGKLGSPFPLSSAQRLEPPTADADGAGDREVDAKEQTPAPSDGRISPGRPVSPTKGMGGFVQSAMMKRTDSVKRWSVSSPKGLQRGDPAAFGMDSAVSRSSNALKEGLSLSSLDLGREKEVGGQSEGGEGADFHVDAEKTTPPSSPTRTMDPRRWSPTKSSSWLEAALNKPESPKPKVSPIPPNQPAWMVELNKAKAQKANSGSADLGRSASAVPKHEVKTGGLMRSTPMGASVKPAPSGSGFPGIRTPDKFSPGDFRSNIAAKLSPKEASEDPEVKSDEGRRGSAVSVGEVPTSAKSKPETPPKKDFRANLKPRAPPSETATPESAAELKNVVGNLRRAKTQNYKAPDELKDNILRGKAALTVTGGPQKSERKDEFKEAILKKKDDFKKAQQEGRGISRTASNTSEQPIPEGLAKSLAITQPGAMKRGSPVSSPTMPSPPLETNGSGFTTPKTVTQRVSPEAAPKPTPESLPKIGKTAVATTLPPQKEASVFSRVQSKASVGGSSGSGGSGGIADRLAGLLARGPPGMASSTSPNSSALNLSSGETGEPSGPGPQLTHMTKNRARGPKRKVPSSVPKASEESEQPQVKPEQQPETKPPKPVVAAKPSGSVNGGRSFSNPKPAALSIAAEPENAIPDTKKASVDSLSKDQTKEEAKPADPSPVRTRQRSPTKIHEQIAAFAAKDQLASKPAADQDGAVSQPSSPKKLDTKRMSRFMDEAGQPRAETEKPLPPSPNKRRPLPDPFVTSSQKEMPPLPKDDVADSPKPPPPPPKNGAMFFGGMGASLLQATSAKPEVTVQTTAASFSSSTTSLPDRSRTPPRGARPMPSSIHVKKDSTQIATPLRSPTKYGFEVSAMLTEFFGPARPRRNYNADAADVLVRRPAAGPIVQTAKAQLYQLSWDGKKQPVRAHYERVLFEREMYLCTHAFAGEGGKKTSEVYFWAGDEVPESTVDDALVFAQREARSFGGKLVRLEQGKETSEFIQALGGIVIVRRGSSNRYDSLAPTMLCGRRYLGQVAFDEVDFSPSSLCSGFPYLIAQDGKCYLWKGKGSDVDELGCARLVGMDLALTGELVEVEDGAEPASFWDDIFGGSSRPQSADHWRLKPNYDRYCGRLFYSNPADKKQIIELSPFNQHDLLPSNIYVLDAFFEMYIIVGAHSQHQYAAFHNALDFAQEYSILAAGMEDRPFIPVSTVVLEGVPRDLKSVFRKWHDGASPTVMNPHNPTSPDLRRGRSLRIVPLNQALQALME